MKRSSRKAEAIRTILYSFVLLLLSATFTAYAQDHSLVSQGNSLGIIRRPLQVFDSNGKFVGAYDFNSVHFKKNGHIFRVGLVSRDGFSKSSLWFESIDCSGLPFQSFSGGELEEAVVVSFPGSTVYLANQNDIRPPTTFVANSELRGDGVCSSAGFAFGFDMAPAIPLIDLNTLFTPPFSVR